MTQQPVTPVVVIVAGVLATIGFFAACGTCAYGIVTVNKAVGWTGFLAAAVMGTVAALLGALEVDARRGLL